MALTAILTFDLIIAAVAVLATIISWAAMVNIKGDLRKVGIMFSSSITLLALRKVFDIIGEVYFNNAPVWSVLEDVSYLIGILLFLYGASISLKYFKKLRFS